MNGAHLHLLVNHIPLFCLLFGALALAASMKSKSADLRLFATVLFVVGGSFTIIAYQSGDAAEMAVKAVDPGADTFINPHEGAAVWALRTGCFVALIAVAMEWAARKQKRFAKGLQWALLIFALHAFSVHAMTALHGGKIRHTEVRN